MSKTTTTAINSASRFAGRPCQQLIAADWARMPAWRRFAGRGDAPWDVRAHAAIVVSHRLRLIYVQNMKAASSYIEGALVGKRASLGAEVETHEITLADDRAGDALRSRVNDELRNYTLFTFVREPTGAFVAGFVETR